MQDRFAAGEITAGHHQRAHLRTRRTFHSHGSTHSETIGFGPAEGDHESVPLVAVVAQHRHAVFKIGVNDVQIAVAIQITEGRSVAHSTLVQAPRRADFLEMQVAHIAIGQVRCSFARQDFQLI